jgi:2,5-diketo-D-gluconate reductase B
MMKQPHTNRMPVLGLGTWENTQPEECRKSVEEALNMGYRHIDTAQAYGSESEVGDGIERSDVEYGDVFLATKVWISNLGYNDVIETTGESLEKLGVDYVDLVYVHWPAQAFDMEETFNAFGELYDRGLVERVGISNFEPEQVEEATRVSDVPIFANQIEVHLMLPQDELIEVCQEQDIEVVAYSPLARGGVFQNEAISEVSNKYDVSEAQVSLAWLRQRGITAIPKATSENHIRDNWESLGLSLSDEDMRLLNKISNHQRRVDPSFAPW